MKKRLGTIVLLMMAGSAALFAQASYSMGVKAGLSLANQGYRITPIDYSLDTEAVRGPTFSLFAEAFRGNHFSLQVDVSYAVKGSSSYIESVSVNHLNNDQITVNKGDKTSSKFKYLSIAPMARYRMGQGSLNPYFLLGPRLDMLLDYNTDSEYPLSEQNGTILGLTLGSGLEYRMNNLGLFAELQYQGDLMPVSGQDPLLINNHMISFTLGLRWLVSE